MNLHPRLKEARFVSRINRFAALMMCDGHQQVAHVANSGRLRELLSPDFSMLLAPAPIGARRKTAYDLALVDVGDELVSVDARLPPSLIQEAIEADVLPEFAGFDKLTREVVFGDSRLDIALSVERELCYVEAKSVTLVDNGKGLFPDSPTLRGRKHLRSLGEAVKQGHRAAVAFVIQRHDAPAFSPNEQADPKFCRTLTEAVRWGVEVYAYRCTVSRQSIEIAGPVPVHLS